MYACLVCEREISFGAPELDWVSSRDREIERRAGPRPGAYPGGLALTPALAARPRMGMQVMTMTMTTVMVMVMPYYGL